jgi:hypothetical protein
MCCARLHRVRRFAPCELAHFPLPPRERLANSLAPPLTPQDHPRKLCCSAARAALKPEEDKQGDGSR